MLSLLQSLKNGTTKWLGAGDINNIKNQLGIDLWECTFAAKEVSKMIRGKEKNLLKINFQKGGEFTTFRHCFFPFQIKQLKLPKSEEK